MNIKVVKIKNKWHARLFGENNEILDEMACSLKEDIGWICREMLRWQDKCWNSTEWTRAARKRQVLPPVGKIWFKKQLIKTKLK